MATVADYILKRLSEQGVDTLFGVPAAYCAPLFDAAGAHGTFLGTFSAANLPVKGRDAFLCSAVWASIGRSVAAAVAKSGSGPALIVAQVNSHDLPGELP
jgi:TPP-dependent 2-oxoacid decarboxylase